MKTVIFILLILILTACSYQQEATVHTVESNTNSPVKTEELLKVVALPDFGLAPELSTSIWLNTPAPLHIRELNGKVILLEMWTYGCINCRNVIPALKEWHARYSVDGLVIIANHFPEFDQERDLENLATAIERLGIPYPITQDNDGANWRAYKNTYWPTLYLIDKNGHIRYTHIGEGNYDKTEQVITALLAE
jgi:thiol-disulfide isomerase/thioredoxin